MMADAAPDVFFGGSLRLTQPRTGHRSGTDAVLLAGAAPDAQCVVDLGSGAGAVGLGLLALGRAQRALLVERDPANAAFARANIALNGFAEKAAVIEADITARAAVLHAAGLEKGMADLVVCNPPFNEPGRHRTSPDAARAAAHEMSPDGMPLWLKAAARALSGNGRLVMIHRPEALPWLLPMIAARFGNLAVLPVQAREGEAASRVLIGGRLNSKAPARLLPALVFHGADGRFTGRAMAIQAGQGRLDLG